MSTVVPTEVQLAFDSALEHTFCAVRVEDPSEGVVTTGEIQHVPGDPNRLAVSIPGLGSGTYRVRWSVEPARPDRCQRGWPRIRLMLLAANAGLTITTPLLLLLRAAEMGRQTLFGTVPLVPRVLAASHYGSVWKVRAAAVVVLWLWVLWRGTGKGPAAVMLVAMLAIGWTYSASGHASAWGDFSLAQIVDGLHVASTAVWVGSLLVLAALAVVNILRFVDASCAGLFR